MAILFGSLYECASVPIDDSTTPVGGAPNFASPIDDDRDGEILAPIESLASGDNFHFGKFHLENASGEDVSLDVMNLTSISFLGLGPVLPAQLRVQNTNASVVGQTATIYYEDNLGNLQSESLVLTGVPPGVTTVGFADRFVRLDLPVPTEPVPAAVQLFDDTNGIEIGAGLEVIYGEIYFAYDSNFGTADDTILNRKDTGNYFGGGAYDQGPPALSSQCIGLRTLHSESVRS